MVDNLTRRGPEDPKKININQAWEIEYWCNEFGITEDKLREAVKAVGPTVATVRIYLGLM